MCVIAVLSVGGELKVFPIEEIKTEVVAWPAARRPPANQLRLSRQHGYYSYIGQRFMKTVNIAELKNRLSVYLNEVRAGHEVLVKDRNTPIARIVPIEHDVSQDDELRVLAGQGKVRLGGKPLDESFWDLPAPRISAATLRRVLEDERSET